MSRFALDPQDERASLVGLVDELLDTGVHVAGDLSIGLADVELVRVALRLLVASEETASRTGVDAGPASPPTARSADAAQDVAADREGGRPDAPRPRPVRSPAPRVAARTPHAPDDDQQIADGVARLVLTLVAVLHDLIERQAVRRVEGGTLTEDQVERLGLALAALDERMAAVRDAFGVTDEELDLDLGPLGTLR